MFIILLAFNHTKYKHTILILFFYLLKQLFIYIYIYKQCFQLKNTHLTKINKNCVNIKIYLHEKTLQTITCLSIMTLLKNFIEFYET
jgi:hypothetical protein